MACFNKSTHTHTSAVSAAETKVSWCADCLSLHFLLCCLAGKEPCVGFHFIFPHHPSAYNCLQEKTEALIPCNCHNQDYPEEKKTFLNRKGREFSKQDQKTKEKTNFLTN